MLSNIFLHNVLDEWFEKELKPVMEGECHLVRYADDWVCLVQYRREAELVRQALGKRFTACELELHPEKTRVISFGRFERENARRAGRRANTFDFLGFTHYCGKSRRGRFIVGRKTSRKKFRKKCRELKEWLMAIRSTQSAKEWWGILRQKLTGHYCYYGISGNMRSLKRYHAVAIRMVRKWLNRRSQRRIYYWKRFLRYLRRFPLPSPRIMVPIYTLATAK